MKGLYSKGATFGLTAAVISHERLRQFATRQKLKICSTACLQTTNKTSNGDTSRASWSPWWRCSYCYSPRIVFVVRTAKQYQRPRFRLSTLYNVLQRLACSTTARITLQASRPSEVLHSDYFFLSSSTDGTKNSLVLMDDFSSYACLSASSYATAEHAVQVLARWQRIFTASHYWVSDQGPHSINDLLRDVADLHNVHYWSTVTYSL